MKYFKSAKYPLELVLSDDNSKSYDTHNHSNHYIFVLPIYGKVNIQFKNKNIECCENEIIIIPPYIPHSIFQQNKMTFLSFCIGKLFIKSYTPNIAEQIVRDFLEAFCSKEIIGYYQKELLINSLRTLYCQKKDYNQNFEADISGLIKHIENQPECNETLTDFSKEIHISKYYFIRKFKNSVGMTPHQFRIQNRIRKAQRLLNNGKTVADVSAEMGFYDQSHFDKYFYRIVGISPSEYIGSIEILN